METSERGGMVVVCDAGPLIHLDEAGCLDLLTDFDEVLVPGVVWMEVERHRPEALTRGGVPFRLVDPCMPAPPELEVLAQVLSLHAGEWAALRVATEHRPGILLTDDTAARLAAGNLRIPVHGTIGIVVRAIRSRQRTKEEVLDVLRKLPSSTSLHLKRELLDRVIREVERS